MIILETLTINEFSQTLFWILFSISILVALVLFFKFIITPKINTKKEISQETMNKAYQYDFKNIQERIDKVENQWQLDNVVYSISRFQHTYWKVKDRLSIEQDVNKLINMWDNKEATLRLSRFIPLVN